MQEVTVDFSEAMLDDGSADPAITFGAIAAAEVTVLIFGWPDRTLGDLLAGTRARLVRS